GVPHGRGGPMTPLLTQMPREGSREHAVRRYRMPGARRPAGRPARRPLVVALVPAHNEAAAIDATIASLRRQTRPPDRIIVVADNCSDATDDLSLLHGAEVVTTYGNTARKAGALNQALHRILPGLWPGDFVLAMDADSQLTTDWIRCAAEALTRDRR